MGVVSSTEIPKGATWRDNDGNWRTAPTDPTKALETSQIVQSPTADEAKLVAQAKKKRSRKNKTKAPPIQFDEQSFLLDNLESINNTTEELLPGDPEVQTYRYKNFLQIKDDDPFITMNKLRGLGLDALNDITTAQMSALVPRLKLFRTITTGDKVTTTEFPFNQFTTVESILESRENRGTDVGLVSIDWDDTGGQPATQGKSFRGQMKLHFQSLEAIFKKRVVNNEEISFAEMMTQQAGQAKEFNHLKASKEEEEEENQTDKPEPIGQCDEEIFNIVLEVGWSISNSDLLKFSKNNLDEQLRNLRRNYILWVDQQEIDVTENGDIELTLKFTAAIEGRAGLATQADILNLDPTNPSDHEHAAEVKIMKAQEEISKKIGANKEDERKYREARKQAGKKVQKNKIDRIRRRRKRLEDKYKTKKSELSGEAYRRILETIRQPFATKGGTEGNNRVFYLDLTPEDMDFYTQMLKLHSQVYQLENKQLTKAQKALVDKYEEARRDAMVRYGQNPSYYIAKEGANSNVNVLTGKTSDTRENIRAARRGKSKKTAQGYVPKIDGNYRIQYIFLGDIIEAVMSVIYNPRLMKGNKLQGKGEVCWYLKQGIKVLLGSFTMIDPWTRDERIMAIADIPVSLNYFNAWWFDNVVSKERQRYTLLDFLQDLCNKLINNVLSPPRYGGRPGYSISLQTQALVLRKGHPLDDEWDNNLEKPKKRININTLLPGGRLSKKKGRQREFSEWLYVAAAQNPQASRKTSQWQPLGFRNKDKEVNVPHFFVGADKGLIKTIKFKRQQIPGQRETYLENQSKNENSKRVRANLLYSDNYNAKITLFGNPSFKIGQTIYIDPRSLGIGPGAEYRSWYTSDLNIGGYYSIIKISNKVTADTFETELDTKQMIGMLAIRNARAEMPKKAT